MKRFLYSNYTKFAAAVIFVICIVFGALTATTGINNIMINEKDMIYQFENDFSESSHLIHLLYEPENIVFNAYHNFYRVDDETESVSRTQHLTVNGQTLEQNIEQRLNDMWSKDKINYYLKWNDRMFTNCGAASPEELNQNEFYLYTMRPGNGDVHIERETGFSNDRYTYYMLNGIEQFDDEDSIEIAVTINEDYLKKCDDSWHRQESLINDLIYRVLVFVVIALIMLIYLICVCGKNKDGEHTSMWIDNVWLEVHLAVIGIIGFFALYIIVALMDDVFSGSFPERIFNIVEVFTAAIASSAILTSLLSIIRNIKRKNFIGSSIILRIVRWCWRMFVKVLKWIYRECKEYKKFVFGALSKKTGIILISMLFAYTVAIGVCVLLIFCYLYSSAAVVFWFAFGVLLFAFAAFVVAYRAKDLDEVKKGVNEICSGNSMYKIPELKSEDMKLLATNINEIGKSIDESVSAKLKAERLKTDLITNVSHDLKTPLTSIINYTELLSKVEGLPEEAKDYAQIIAQKSDRLKNLTQDLFDISKVQSGNENVVFERLDASLLINQSLAEHDSEIQKSGLKFCVDAPKELYISADGRKMSRVISNLINNILKYTMKNTRVFITAFERDNEVIMEFKNIASYPMEFDAEEIMGRFVRGDESRTEEGNGLGLAIARSYTEVCNGSFDVVLDGDLFKAIIKFSKY